MSESDSTGLTAIGSVAVRQALLSSLPLIEQAAKPVSQIPLTHRCERVDDAMVMDWTRNWACVWLDSGRLNGIGRIKSRSIQVAWRAGSQLPQRWRQNKLTGQAKRLA
jgi:hypothetical protein